MGRQLGREGAGRLKEILSGEPVSISPDPALYPVKRFERLGREAHANGVAGLNLAARNDNSHDAGKALDRAVRSTASDAPQQARAVGLDLLAGIAETRDLDLSAARKGQYGAAGQRE
jgi:hypothetical protein